MQTYGWDTVFVCSVDKINALIAANTTTMISSFSYDDGAIAFSGTFGPWRITAGGSDTLLNFVIPVASGTFHSGLSGNCDIAGIEPVMQLQLSFIADGSVTNDQQLRFDLSTVGAHPGDTTPGAVTTITPDSTARLRARDKTGLVGAMLQDALPELLIANKSKLAFVFASINMVPLGSASHFAPKRLVYHYQQPAAGGPSFLGILSSVTDRDVSHLQQAIDPTLLVGGYDLFYVIAPWLFLEYVVMPGMPAAFGHGTTSSNFVFSSGAIRNSGQLGVDNEKVGLIQYYPHVDLLSIVVSSDDLVSNASGSFDITGLANAYVTFSVTTRNTITFDVATQSIRFNGDPNPSRDYDKHIPWYDYAFAAIGGPAIVLIVDLVMNAVTSAVASSVSDSVGDGDLSVGNMATQSIRFAGLNRFAIKDAGLSDGFYLRGAFD